LIIRFPFEASKFALVITGEFETTISKKAEFSVLQTPLCTTAL